MKLVRSDSHGSYASLWSSAGNDPKGTTATDAWSWSGTRLGLWATLVTTLLADWAEDACLRNGVVSMVLTRLTREIWGGEKNGGLRDGKNLAHGLEHL